MYNVGDRGYVHPTHRQTIFEDPCGFEFRADNNVPSRLKEMALFSKSLIERRKLVVTRSVQSELVSHLIESQD